MADDKKITLGGNHSESNAQGGKGGNSQAEQDMSVDNRVGVVVQPAPEPTQSSITLTGGDFGIIVIFLSLVIIIIGFWNKMTEKDKIIAELNAKLQNVVTEDKLQTFFERINNSRS